MHFGMVVLLFWFAHLFGLGRIAMCGMEVVAVLLAYEHSDILPGDLRRMNAAFFTLNGVISVVFFLAVAVDVFVRR